MNLKATAGLLALMTLLGACAGQQEERALLPEQDCNLLESVDPCFAEEYHRGM